MRHRIAMALATVSIAVLALLRIADTYSVFNHTYDEVFHIAGGMQWLDQGRYDADPFHPPMRSVYAVGPWLLGSHAFGEPSLRREGQRILYDGGDYKRVLTAARIGALPFFLLALALVGVWAARIAGPSAALAAVLAYSMLPLALAHAGLATTDTLVAGTLTLAYFAWAWWLEAPSHGRALAFGAAAALAVLSKFSSIPFLGAAVLVSLAFWVARGRPDGIRSRLRIVAESALFAVLIGSLIVWAGYRFSFAPVVDIRQTHAPIDQLFGASGWSHDLAYGLVELPVPAPEFFRGLRDLADQTRQGYPAYLMGETFDHGRWYFFPVGMLVKTPIAFLLLSALGLAVLSARCWKDTRPVTCVPVLGIATITAVVIPSPINIGMRHILPMFPLLAIAVGVGVAFLWQHRRTSPTGIAAALILLSWLVISSARAHPDYLAYFNECCDRNPQSWLVDSDLDWGQDLDRLAGALKAKQVEHIQLAYFGTADLAHHGLPRTTVLRPVDRVHGWVAVSEFRFVMGEPSRILWPPPNTEYKWLEAYGPYERVGKSIRVYNVP